MLSAYQRKRVTLYYNGKVTLFDFRTILSPVLNYQIRVWRKIPRGYIKTVAKLFYRDDRNIPAGAVHHTVGGGGRYSGESGQTVNVQMPFTA